MGAPVDLASGGRIEITTANLRVGGALLLEYRTGSSPVAGVQSVTAWRSISE